MAYNDGTIRWTKRDVDGYHMYHRIDGPAIEYPDGGAGWYLNDVYLTFDDWLDQTTGLTEEEKVMFKLQYG
jgi:peptidoglycan/xylan/chitin deacetylase (PgdA/CDA1 family)